MIACTKFDTGFLAHLSRRFIGELSIGRPPSSVRRLSSTLFFYKHLLLRNHWANQSQISYGASIGWGNEIFSNGPGHMPKMAALPIYGKNL